MCNTYKISKRFAWFAISIHIQIHGTQKRLPQTFENCPDTSYDFVSVSLHTIYEHEDEHYTENRMIVYSIEIDCQCRT